MNNDNQVAAADVPLNENDLQQDHQENTNPNFQNEGQMVNDAKDDGRDDQ